MKKKIFTTQLEQEKYFLCFISLTMLVLVLMGLCFCLFVRIFERFEIDEL